MLIQTSPQDLGYEVNEEECAREMQVQIQNRPADPAAPEFDPEEFELIYQWFFA